MNEELIKSEILNGLQQVDESFIITDFYIDFDSKERKLSCSFVASNDNGDTISEVIDYA